MKTSELLSVLYLAVSNEKDSQHKLASMANSTKELAQRRLLRAEILGDIASVLYETAAFVERKEKNETNHNP